MYNEEKIEGDDMEKLIEKYKKECDKLSKLASRLWKIIVTYDNLLD